VGLWRFFQIRAGDLVVALEGTRVCGIAQATAGALTGYWFDFRYHYAQCIGTNVRWLDGNTAKMPEKPTAPAQGVLAATQLQNDRALVLAAWTDCRWTSASTTMA
jgi:hypothetical protein